MRANNINNIQFLKLLSIKCLKHYLLNVVTIDVSQFIYSNIIVIKKCRKPLEHCSHRVSLLMPSGPYILMSFFIISTIKAAHLNMT